MRPRCQSTTTSCTFETGCEQNRFRKMFAVLRIIFIIGFIGVAYAFITDNLHSVMSDIKQNAESVQGLEKKLDDLIKGIKKLQRDADSKCPKSDPKEYQNALKELIQQYDADKTGRPDYALESAGGKILTIRETKNYPSEVVKLLGVTICSSSNEPKLMIMPGSNPGECWAFKGQQGSAVIELIGYIYVTGVTLEHIPKSVSPTGDIKTAPKEFSIWGLTCIGEPEGEILGHFHYKDNGMPLQYFAIEKTPKPYKLIEFKVHSNHGNPEFTCVYRLRVHGDLESGLS